MKDDDGYPHPENWKDKDRDDIRIGFWEAVRTVIGMAAVFATLAYMMWLLALLASWRP